MESYIGLSSTEQVVYNNVRDLSVLSLDKVTDLFPSLQRQQLLKVLSSLTRKGYLHRVRRGLYLLTDPFSDQPVIEDPMRIALELFDGYLAFDSALRVYDLLEYEVFTIQVASSHRTGHLEVGQYEIRCVNMGQRAQGMTVHKGLRVSTLEKTFFDCLYRPSGSGGYGVITKAIFDAGNIDWRMVDHYFDIFASRSLCQRSGYVLQLLKDITGAKVPASTMDRLHMRIGRDTKLVSTMPSRGKYIREWRLIDNLGERSILGWYDGR